MSDAIREKALLDSQALIIELLPNDNQRDLSISKSTGWLCNAHRDHADDTHETLWTP